MLARDCAGIMALHEPYEASLERGGSASQRVGTEPIVALLDVALLARGFTGFNAGLALYGDRFRGGPHNPKGIVR